MKPEIPTFVVTGQPNEGKTSVMSTFTEDDTARIEPLPGTTTEARRYAIRVDDREVLSFYDTPGFQQPGAVLDWFRETGAGMPNPALAFVEEFRNTKRFPDESEIFRPIAEGAAIVHVVDATRPVREVDRQEIEILRLCGNPRIALINLKSEEDAFVDAWQNLLSRDFNLRRKFHPHRSTFADRMALLEAIKLVIQDWEPEIERTRQALLEDRKRRTREAADEVLDFLRAAVGMRERELLTASANAQELAPRLKRRLEERLREMEQKFREKQRRLFRHSGERWTQPEPLEADVFSKEVWRLFGLSQQQLALAGAVMGGATGGAVDLLVGGTSLAAFALGGAVIGGAAAWFGAEQAVKVDLPDVQLGPVRLGTRKLGGRHAEARVDVRSNLPWILLDRALLYTEVCMTWAHGRRETNVPLRRTSNAKAGVASALSRAERKEVASFFADASKGNTDGATEHEREVRRCLIDLLEQVDRS